jgi:aminopeptidase N
MPYEVKKCSCQTNDAFTISGGKPHYAPDLKLEPKHLDISINLQLENKFLEISVLTTIECNQPESSITFNGESFESLKVTDVTENKSYQDEVKFFYDGKLINVFWENKLKKNEKRILKIDYQITKPVTGIQFNTENKNRKKKISHYKSWSLCSN